MGNKVCVDCGAPEDVHGKYGCWPLKFPKTETSDKAASFMQKHVEEAFRKRLSEKESYVAHYLAATGTNITTLTLCEQLGTDGVLRWWLEPKGER